MICTIGFGIESNNVSKKHFGKLTFFLFISAVMDFLWILYNLINWAYVSPYEGESLDGIRRFSVVISFVVLLLKVI